MKKKSIWKWMSYLMTLVGGAKCGVISYSQEYSRLPFWVMGIAWVIWVLLAFRFDKDLPAVGPFGYQNGDNQLARLIYTIMVISIFLVAVFFS